VKFLPVHGLDNRISIPGRSRDFFRHRVQTGPVVHSSSYPMGTGGPFPRSKAAGAWSWLLTSISCRC